MIMQISHTAEINDSADNIWKKLSSLEGIETYLPIVNKSKVDGKGIGAIRISEINMGSQYFQIREKILDFDESKRYFTTLLEDAPIQIKGMQFNFLLSSKGEKKSTLTMSTSVVNPDSQSMAKNFFEMIGEGLKRIHEL